MIRQEHGLAPISSLYLTNVSSLFQTLSTLSLQFQNHLTCHIQTSKDGFTSRYLHWSAHFNINCKPSRLTYASDPVPIAIIGGTGLGALPSPPFTPIALIPPPKTPWGVPSSPISILSYQSPKPGIKSVTVAFLARHGLNHNVAPHEINNRANVAALKKLGVTSVIGFSAVGSLREEVKPRDFCIAGGVVDWTKGVSRIIPSSPLGC